MHLHDEQRVAADVEEVVLHAHLLAVQDRLPCLGDQGFEALFRRDEGYLSGVHYRSRCRQGLAVDLPVGR